MNEDIHRIYLRLVAKKALRPYLPGRSAVLTAATRYHSDLTAPCGDDPLCETPSSLLPVTGQTREPLLGCKTAFLRSCSRVISTQPSRRFAPTTGSLCFRTVLLLFRRISHTAYSIERIIIPYRAVVNPLFSQKLGIQPYRETERASVRESSFPALN